MKIKFYNSRKDEIISLQSALHLGLAHIKSNEIICRLSGDKLLRGLGINDNNGCEIFEGDIVFKNDRKWFVEYGYFRDACFYVSNGLNSGRVIECEQDVYFSDNGTNKHLLFITGNINIQADKYDFRD